MTARSMPPPRPSSGCSPHVATYPASAAEREARQGGERPARTGLAKHAEIAHLQRPVDEAHELPAQQVGDRRPLAVIADTTGQGEVEAPLLEHVGIAPAQQQLFL